MRYSAVITTHSSRNGIPILDCNGTLIVPQEIKKIRYSAGALVQMNPWLVLKHGQRTWLKVQACRVYCGGV